MLLLVLLICLVTTVKAQCLGCDVDETSAYCWDLHLESLPPCLPPSLTYLDVYRATIPVLGASAFQNLKSLEILYLDDDQLQLLEPGVFRPLENLTQIGLAGNVLSSLPEDLFSNNAKLRLVDLSANRLETLAAVLFQGLPLLERLILRGNGLLLVLDSFPASLRALDLSGNLLASLEPSSLAALTSGATVSLQGNPWLCDCRTTTIINAFRANNVTLAEDPSCAAPQELQGLLWSQLPDLCSVIRYI